MIRKNQTEKGRLISESGRIISDILEIFNTLIMKGFLVTLDIENTLDLVNHLLLITALENYGFKDDLTKWIQIAIQNRKSCVINGETATDCFRPERGTR